MGALELVLDSKAKLALLRKIVSNENAFSISELSRLSDLPKATVSITIKAWEKAGFAVAMQQGRNKLVRINKAFYLLPELKKIAAKAPNEQKKFFERAKATASKYRKIKAMVVFGSRARGDFSHQSDMDILICLQEKETNTEQILMDFVKASQKIGIGFSPVFLDSGEIRSRLIEKDQFILNVLSQGKIIKGEKWLGNIQAASGSGKRKV